jgi:hypothetical protein
VERQDIDHYQQILANNHPNAMPGIAKTHHIFSNNDKVLYRALSCHCCDQQLCLTCYKPQYINRLPEICSEKRLKKGQPQIPLLPLEVDNWVAVAYETKWFIGQVKTKRPGSLIEVVFMKETRENIFHWPESIDSDVIYENSVLSLISIPSARACGSNRRLLRYSLSSPEYDRICSLFESI